MFSSILLYTGLDESKEGPPPTLNFYVQVYNQMVQQCSEIYYVVVFGISNY